jgi:Domain of unknown function (DUF4326)
MRHRLLVDDSVPLGPPRVVHCERERYHHYIGRPGPLGNPFVIDIHGTREQVLAKHEAYVDEHPELLPLILALRGLVLGCWCDPEPCHGHLYIRMANPELALSA